MKRYEKFVLEAEKGITIELSEGKSGKLVIRARNIDTSNDNCTVEDNFTADNNYINYENPPIPEGYKHICGEWNNGFVIERSYDGSQFVWIPVESLEPDGTLDGEYFSEKFGRRDYDETQNSVSDFKEPLSDELIEQLVSVKKYGGFYISRYNISKNKKTGEPQSIKGVMPWVDIKFLDAKKVASTIEYSERVKSHLTFGAEYDSILEWFMETNVKTYNEIACDSTEWGNYRKEDNCGLFELAKTGSREEWCANNIYDFAGNVEEWTQEQKKDPLTRVIRGGSYRSRGGTFPVGYRFGEDADYCLCGFGFRAALWIK